ncbi:type II toxin-antitoxin system RelE/ParE family toxin [Rhizobium leguminosarum]|uniref:type II toxin-antitoxin system RelE/ParE family toxin n=1 Tax=Rhizobium leguminosarum TaxID=384 RepID=UPI001C8FC4F5|nr:type II toxin-antitoxin system RelE/ParE family toxin [Rhizobium leguminosarum]MBY2909865.1 type II toxin-antitoxin system RelE/ParE family toxin [Rhizobium leguminosarum]
MGQGQGERNCLASRFRGDACGSAAGTEGCPRTWRLSFSDAEARVDVKQIFVAIGKEQAQAAERYFRQFRYKAGLLIDHPRLGERHAEIFRTARMLVEAPYVILYETHPDTDEGEVDAVEIVRMVDGRRDLAALF